jgi:hypothetical protein
MDLGWGLNSQVFSEIRSRHFSVAGTSLFSSCNRLFFIFVIGSFKDPTTKIEPAIQRAILPGLDYIILDFNAVLLNFLQFSNYSISIFKENYWAEAGHNPLGQPAYYCFHKIIGAILNFAPSRRTKFFMAMNLHIIILSILIKKTSSNPTV